jgi:hypothetical protein
MSVIQVRIESFKLVICCFFLDVGSEMLLARFFDRAAGNLVCLALALASEVEVFAAMFCLDAETRRTAKFLLTELAAFNPALFPDLVTSGATVLVLEVELFALALFLVELPGGAAVLSEAC